MEEGSIAKWHKKEGDFVKEGDLLVEIATDKATIEHNALDEGWLKKIIVREGGSAVINQPLAIFTAEENESIENFKVEEPKKAVEAPKPKEEVAPTAVAPKPQTAPAAAMPAFVPEPPLAAEKPHATRDETRAFASPLARKLAEQRGLDLTTVKGSGPGGRVVAKDLERAQPAGLVTFGRTESPEEAAGSYEEIPLSPMRKVIAKRLEESKSYVPHFYVKQIIDAAPLVSLREQLKSYNLNVTYNDLVIKACAIALREHPQVNAGFNTVNQTIIQFKTIDISIAVTVDAGLITPIIRHADYKNVGQISQEVKKLAEKARHLKLEKHEYSGGSFCVSNLGMFGITEFSAIINPPQAAILAVGGIEDRPVVKNGQVVAGKTLSLVLSADHRVIDGALGAQFMKTLQHILENPVALTL